MAAAAQRWTIRRRLPARSRSPNGLRARADLALTRTCDRGFVWAPSAAWNLQQGEVLTGLTATQARIALQRHGANALPRQKPTSFVAWLSQQLKSALIYVFER